MRHSSRFATLCFSIVTAVLSQSAARLPGKPAAKNPDRDLMEISVPQLESLYASHRYSVSEVTRWYLARIHHYNGIYRAVEQIDEQGALATAARLDAEAKSGMIHSKGDLWGVPIVIKANTSIRGFVTTDGWRGYTIPGHELIAPKDATIVSRLRAAGAVILGHTNMPDFAASDTNRSSSFGRTGNAYDVRFSPGGSSGGTVTAITSNEAVLGNGTDTGNSIRMPSSTSSVVGYFPTRGLVPISGIAPLDWLLDNTGPIARSVTDVAIALTVMAGPDAADPRTLDAAKFAQPGPYARYLQPGALKGRRFGVPAFIMQGLDAGFQGYCPGNARRDKPLEVTPFTRLHDDTRTIFLQALDELRAAGAEIVISEDILPASFARIVSHICTLPYVRQGTEMFLATYGPSQYHSVADYARVVGSPLPNTILGGIDVEALKDPALIVQVLLESDPNAETTYWQPRREALAVYLETLDSLHLDGFVYPAAQMPPPDETMPQQGEPGNLSGGPHSDTAWVNQIGVPAVSLPGGFYTDGLPFGLEISARPWRDGDLLGFAYAYEQATHHRHAPVLVEKGLLPDAR